VRRTIHGLIYNALKLFMEMNQKLFDECTQSYARQREEKREQQQAQQHKWQLLQLRATESDLVSWVCCLSLRL